MERKLATIRKISKIEPIKGADAIELATVDDWKVVIGKNVGFKVGDSVIYCEIDSFLPIRDEFEFLRKTSYKKMGDKEGFRLRTIELMGKISQGLIIPMHILGEDNTDLEIGTDVSEMLGIIKYEAPIPASLSGRVKSGFPSFIFKTDERRIQNLTNFYENYKEKTFYVTEKLDGTSATFYIKDGVFGVCGRNYEFSKPIEDNLFFKLAETIGIKKLLISLAKKIFPKLEFEANSFWKVAAKIDLKNLMAGLGKNICLQGELVGEGIQNNIYKLKGQHVFFYNVFDIDKQEYYDFENFVETIESLGLKTVPILYESYKLPDSIDELLIQADGVSEINNSMAKREGIVVRSLDRKISFKVISNNFLLKQKEKQDEKKAKSVENSSC